MSELEDFKAWAAQQKAQQVPAPSTTNPTKTDDSELEAFRAWAATQASARVAAPSPQRPTPPQGNALMRGLEYGETMLQTALGSTAEGLGKTIGLDALTQLGQRNLADANEEAAVQAPQRTNLADINSLGSFATYLGEMLGEQLPQVGASLVGAKAGAIAGAPFGAPIAGAIIGGIAAQFPLHYGFNREAQKEAAKEKGITLEVDEGAAAITAVPQATLDFISDRIAFLGFAPKAGQALLTRVVKGGVRGAAVEVPTEIGQEVLQRLQAGQDLTSDDAIKQYIEAGAAAGILGKTIGMVGGAIAPDKDGGVTPAATPEKLDDSDISDEALGTKPVPNEQVLESVQAEAPASPTTPAQPQTAGGNVGNTPQTPPGGGTTAAAPISVQPTQAFPLSADQQTAIIELALQEALTTQPSTAQTNDFLTWLSTKPKVSATLEAAKKAGDEETYTDLIKIAAETWANKLPSGPLSSAEQLNIYMSFVGNLSKEDQRNFSTWFSLKPEFSNKLKTAAYKGDAAGYKLAVEEAFNAWSSAGYKGPGAIPKPIPVTGQVIPLTDKEIFNLQQSAVSQLSPQDQQTVLNQIISDPWDSKLEKAANAGDAVAYSKILEEAIKATIPTTATPAAPAAGSIAITPQKTASTNIPITNKEKGNILAKKIASMDSTELSNYLNWMQNSSAGRDYTVKLSKAGASGDVQAYEKLLDDSIAEFKKNYSLGNSTQVTPAYVPPQPNIIFPSGQTLSDKIDKAKKDLEQATEELKKVADTSPLTRGLVDKVVAPIKAALAVGNELGLNVAKKRAEFVADTKMVADLIQKYNTVVGLLKKNKIPIVLKSFTQFLRKYGLRGDIVTFLTNSLSDLQSKIEMYELSFPKSLLPVEKTLKLTEFEITVFQNGLDKLHTIGLDADIRIVIDSSANLSGRWQPTIRTLTFYPTGYKQINSPVIRADWEIISGHEILHIMYSFKVFNTLKGQRLYKQLQKWADAQPDSVVIGNIYSQSQLQEEKIAELVGSYWKAKLNFQEIKSPITLKRTLATIRQGFEIVIDMAREYVLGPRAGFLPKIDGTPAYALEYITSKRVKHLVDEALFGAAPNLGAQSKTRLDQAIATTNSAWDAYHRITGQPVDRAEGKGGTDYYNWIVQYGWNIIQLAKKNSHIPWLQTYKQLADKWYNAKTQWLARGNATIEKWREEVGSQNAQAVALTLFDLEQMNYRTPQEVKQGVVRHPTRQELIALLQKNGARDKRAVELYVHIRKDLADVLNKTEEIALKNVEKTYADSIMQAAAAVAAEPDPSLKQLLAIDLKNKIMQRDEQIKKTKAEFAAMRAKPYFPHARFGNYTIVVYDNNGKLKYMEAFEKESERNRALKSVKEAFPNDKVSGSFLSQEVQQFKGIPPTILQSIKRMLQEQMISGSAEEKALISKQITGIEEIMVQLSPTQSFKHHFTRKKDTPGYSRDATRAYADYMWHWSNHIARLEYGPLMQEAINEGARANKELQKQGVDTTKRFQMLDYLQHHLNQILNPSPDWAMLKSLGFLWWLGFNVKSAVLNFTQIPLVTVPYLSAHFGDVKTAVQLAKTMSHLQKVFRSPEKAKHTPQDMALLKLGLQQGFLDESFAMELAATAQGGILLNKLASGSKAERTFLKFQKAAGYMFQSAEKINRRVTFLTAVELARKNPDAKFIDEVVKQHQLEYDELLQSGMAASEARAFLAGKDAVRSTQFEYSAWARPRMMEGRASLILTFFMFTQNMLWFIQNSPGSTRYLITLLLFAGIMGMPGAEDLEALAKFLGRFVFGEEWNAEKELREFLIQYTDDPDLFLRGASRYGFGLHHLGDMTGIPLPSVDLSGSLGMGSPLPIVSPLIQALGRGGDLNDEIAAVTQEGVGATLGIGLGIFQAMVDTQLPLDDPKRWEKAMPAFLGNASKALRFAREGKERFRNSAGQAGPEVLPFDVDNPKHMAEIVAQALGFRSTRLSETWDKVLLTREVEAFWVSQSVRHLQELDRAVANGENVDEAIQAIRRFNQQVPYASYRISIDTMKRSLATRQRLRNRMEAGLPRTNKAIEIQQDIDRLFPGQPSVTREPIK